MGSSKDYIALPADEKALDTSSPPPPPYEEKHPRFPLRWKVICLLLTFVGLTIVGFCIHPDREHGHLRQVDLGFPQGTQPPNLAQDALTDFMTRIVHEAEQDPRTHDHPHPHPHHHPHHHHHGKHHDHDHPQSKDHENHPHHGKHPHHHHHPHDGKHHEHSSHHGHHDHPPHPPQSEQHHHQKREDDDTVYIQKLPTHHRYQPPTKHVIQKREDDDTVYIQKLPTHHRYQPPTKHANQRRELAAALTGGKHQQPWIQSYRLMPSANTSLHILSAHVHSSLMGDVTLRQDTTGIEQDIVITFRTNAADGVIPVLVSTNNYGDAFFLRARSAPHHGPSFKDYSIDIVFPSGMTTMKNLNIHINNGTIHADASLQVTFDATKFSVNHGAMSIQKLTADRIMLGTYSGVISGTFQPKDRFSVGAYYGHSNVRLLQSSAKSDHCRHLHIAASSPHGVSEIALEHGAFAGQFLAYRTLEDAPKVNFTSNDKQLYETQVVDQRYSGWFMNNSPSSQLIIHGHDETTLTFE